MPSNYPPNVLAQEELDQAVPGETQIPSTKNWAGQFVISDRQTETPAEFRSRRIGSIWLSYHDSIELVRINDELGRHIGFFVGTVVDYENCSFLADEIRIRGLDTLDGRCETHERTIEDFIYSFAGRYLCLIAYRDFNRVYLDAAACLSLVFDAEQRIAASTTGLLLTDQAYIDRFESRLFEALDVLGNGWFPSGLTAHAGVSRLLGSHYLDLGKWKAIRHWPRNDMGSTSAPMDHYERIFEIIRRTAASIVDGGETGIALTAGYDSRLVLAAVRPMIDRVTFVTVSAPGENVDLYQARSLGDRFHLKHQVLPLKLANEHQKRAWLYQSGHCVGGVNMRIHPSVDALSAFQFLLGGDGGGVAKAHYSRSSDGLQTKLSGEKIVRRLGLPKESAVIEATNSWLGEIKDLHPLTQLDLAYLELRGSAWAFPQAYAGPAGVIEISPILCRESCLLMMELPAELRKTKALPRECVRMYWPELLEVPVNKYGDIRDQMGLLRKVANVRRKLRQIAG